MTIRADSGLGSIDSGDQSTWNFGSGGGGGGGGGSRKTQKPQPQVYLGTVKNLPKYVGGDFTVQKHYEGISPATGAPQFSTSGGTNRPLYDLSGKKDSVVSLDQAKQQWYNMSDKERENWRQYALALGLISQEDSGNFSDLEKSWEKATEEAAKWYAAGKKINPYQAARLMASPVGTGLGSPAMRDGSAAPKSLAGRQTQRSVTVNLTDPATARAIVASAMQQYLGQDPTEDQVNTFTGTLNDYERAHPNVRTTTVTTDAQGNSKDKTVNSGGVTPDAENDLLKHQVMSLPSYGAYQASTTLMNWLESALATPAGN